jgi:starch synthase
MRILHVSAECYPAAKAGGLGDVVGSLPKYLCKAGIEASVIMPGYKTPWIKAQSFSLVFSGLVRMVNVQVPFYVRELNANNLGFRLLIVDVPGLFDREGIYIDQLQGYGYADETERYLVFQQAVLQFIQQENERPDVLHCHDHHTGLIPFMVKHCPEFRDLQSIPTVFTIHNGVYHGSFSWSKAMLLPWYDGDARGLLDWAGLINPLATGIKCCWQLTTVSPSYLLELLHVSNGLEWLIQNELHKASGIINGIDTQVWNPQTDPFLSARLENDLPTYKAQNKRTISKRFEIQPELPLITFIGRLVAEKGADLLPDAIAKFLFEGGKASFVVLGAGDPQLKSIFLNLKNRFFSYFDTSIEYNEELSHQLYAGSDFLVMPSRVEPCGLNQLYAFRYGTVPIVRTTGGLADTVTDISQPNGNGLRFDMLSIDALSKAFHRAEAVYNNTELFSRLRDRIVQLDYSWEKSAELYLQLYQRIT